MSETRDAFGPLLRQLQSEVRGIGTKLDLLTRARERDLASVATRDDLRDVVSVLVEQLSGFDQRISGAVGQVAEAIAENGSRLSTIEERLLRIETGLAPPASPAA